MDPHPLSNLFKRSNYYLYEVLLEIHESKNYDGIYKVIHDSSLNEKHDCNDVIIHSINFNCANIMQNPKLADANFAMSTNCNDHDWGDSSYDLENLFKPHDGYDIDNSVCNNIESGFVRVPTLGNMIPLLWRMINPMKFLIKVGLERSWP